MDLSMILSIIAVAVSLADTLLIIRYSRINRRSTAEELKEKIQNENTKSSVQDLRLAVYESEREITRVQTPEFPALYSLRDSVIEHFHNHRTKRVEVVIRPINILYKVQCENRISEVTMSADDSFEVFWLEFKKDFRQVIFHFSCDFGPLQDSYLDLTDSMFTIKRIYNAVNRAKTYSETIERFSQSAFVKLEDTIASLLRNLHRELMTEDHVVITSDLSPDEIYELLLNKIVAHDSIKQVLDTVQGQLSQEIARVQSGLFQESTPTIADETAELTNY